MKQITSRLAGSTSSFGKAFLMTTAPHATTPLTLDDALVATAAETAAHDQADAAAADRAATAVARARRESRQMAVAWVSLFAGLVVSLGVFGAIAWQHSEAADGPGTHVAVSTAP